MIDEDVAAEVDLAGWASIQGRDQVGHRGARRATWSARSGSSGRLRKTTCAGSTSESLKKELIKAALEIYARRPEEFSGYDFKEVEKMILLQMIDKSLERPSVRPRPPQEGDLPALVRPEGPESWSTRKESAQMLGAMIDRIRESTVEYVFKVEAPKAPPPREIPEDARRGRASAGRDGVRSEHGAPRAASAAQEGDRARTQRAVRRGKQRPARHPEDRPQRSLLLRLRQEVQEMPRGRPSLISAFLGAALAGLSLPRAGLWVFGWIGLIPFFLAANAARSRRSAGFVGFAAGFGYHAVVLHWIYATCRFAQIPPLVAVLAWCALSNPSPRPELGSRWFSQRLKAP